MTTNPSEHDPLENLFRCLEIDADDLTDAQLKESLRDRGLDPEATTAVVAAKVNGFLKSRRLSWQDAAKQKQAALQAAATQVLSWGTKKKEEIEAAFEKARQGTYGSATQLKLQTAFRNLSNIPTEDKASFLDELETLQNLKESAPPSPGAPE